MRYARNQREGLQRFLSDCRLPLDNNISERELRRQAVGRKNWLFVGSDDGAETNAVFTSLLASCRMHQVEPWAYLRDLLCLLPEWPKHRLLELAPAYWAETEASDDAQRLLEANPYRAVTLER
ncbi:MAG: transposase [Sandaracinaceae bacterium]